MADVVIENPILNSPYEEPRRHFRFGDDGITSEIVEDRRASSYFVPIPPPKVKGKQLSFETEWTKDRIRENEFINRIRGRVTMWRRGGYVDVTRATRQLLGHWTDPERARRLLFCQIEAVETAIYLTEVAPRYDAWMISDLRDLGPAHDQDLYRVALKMATGTGKTVVMAMLIAWHALNKAANKQDARFADAFLVVAPGITIRDRLRVLLPSDPNNYYRAWDVVPPGRMGDLRRAKVIVTNFHTFLPREGSQASALTKRILTRNADDGGVFRESPAQVARRVCRELGGKRNIVVINDEAHHCYRPKPSDDGKVAADERREAEQNAADARVWISGLEAVKRKFGIRVVYDLSATPFFLSGSGYHEGTLFPWVVSDFALIDAIESGLVKVPRVPVDDSSRTDTMPAFRNIWVHIRDHLPKKTARADLPAGEPMLPTTLAAALHALYSNYEKYYAAWETNAEARAAGLTPPVFIVVCNNTSVSKLVYDYIAGWEKPLSDGTSVVVPGALPTFSNERDGRWVSRPNTILVDSAQLESGEAMSPAFKAVAVREIEEFKAEYRIRLALMPFV